MLGAVLLSLSLLLILLGQDSYERAVMAFREARFEEVLSLLTLLPEKEANRPAPFNLKALALSQLHRYDEALAANQRARQLDPANPNYIYNAGAIYLAKEDFQGANKVFRQAIQQFPKSSRLFQGLGETLYELKRYREAEQWLRKAVDIEPGSATAQVALAYLFYALGDRENFGKSAARAIQLDPSNYQACYHYGKWLIEDREQTVEGGQFILKSIELNPSFVEGLKTWGNLLSKQDRWEDAVQIYERALAIDAGNKQLYYLLSIAYRKTGKLERAEWALSKYRIMD